jgi:hypothetical protein
MNNNNTIEILSLVLGIFAIIIAIGSNVIAYYLVRWQIENSQSIQKQNDLAKQRSAIYEGLHELWRHYNGLVNNTPPYSFNYLEVERKVRILLVRPSEMTDTEITTIAEAVNQYSSMETPKTMLERVEKALTLLEREMKPSMTKVRREVANKVAKLLAQPRDSEG